MNFFVLKRSWTRLGFELGFFNLFALAVLLPIFWLDYLNSLCWESRCCHHSMELFYQDNLSRLVIIGIVFVMMTALEVLALRLSIERGDSEPASKTWIRYLVWMFFRNLSVLTLLLAVLALLSSQFFYWVLASCGMFVFLGSEGAGNQWGPVFALNQGELETQVEEKEPVQFRHHLKGLMIYLSGLLVGIPVLYLFQAVFQFGQIETDGCISSIRSNMLTFQTVVETYAVDWDGMYPETLDALETEARAKEYWKEITNPYLWAKDTRAALAMMPGSLDVFEKQVLSELVYPYRDILGIRIYHESFLPERVDRGLVLYDYVSPSLYYLYGIDENGKFLRHRGHPLTLSNS